MTDLPHSLERRIHIRAPRAVVFRFLTETTGFARWWGEGSSIDARPGGAVRIHYPNGVIAGGEVREVVDGERLVFTYGYESGTPLPLGSTRVTIELHDDAPGTTLCLRHELGDAALRDAHLPGWSYQLAVFANLVADEQHARADREVDRFFASWSIPDDETRRKELQRTVTDDLCYRDRHGLAASRSEFEAHVAAVQQHVGRATVRRAGDVHHCQGRVLARWEAVDSDGAPFASGTNVFELAADGRIRDVVAFWDAPNR